MTAPTEEKLTSSTLQSSTPPAHVGGRERERRRATDHFFGKNENSSIQKLFGSAVSESSTIGTQRSAVTLS